MRGPCSCVSIVRNRTKSPTLRVPAAIPYSPQSPLLSNSSPVLSYTLLPVPCHPSLPLRWSNLPPSIPPSVLLHLPAIHLLPFPPFNLRLVDNASLEAASAFERKNVKICNNSGGTATTSTVPAVRGGLFLSPPSTVPTVQGGLSLSLPSTVPTVRGRLSPSPFLHLAFALPGLSP